MREKEPNRESELPRIDELQRQLKENNPFFEKLRASLPEGSREEIDTHLSAEFEALREKILARDPSMDTEYVLHRSLLSPKLFKLSRYSPEDITIYSPADITIPPPIESSNIPEEQDSGMTEPTLPPLKLDRKDRAFYRKANRYRLERLSEEGDAELPLVVDSEFVKRWLSEKPDYTEARKKLMDSMSDLKSLLRATRRTSSDYLKELIIKSKEDEGVKLRSSATLFRVSLDQDRPLGERLSSLATLSEVAHPSVGAVGLLRLTQEEDLDVVESAMSEMSIHFPDIAGGLLAKMAVTHEDSYIQMRAFCMLAEVDREKAHTTAQEIYESSTDEDLLEFVEDRLKHPLMWEPDSEQPEVKTEEHPDYRQSPELSAGAFEELARRTNAVLAGDLGELDRFVKNAETKNIGLILATGLYFETDEAEARAKTKKYLSDNIPEYAGFVESVYEVEQRAAHAE